MRKNDHKPGLIWTILGAGHGGLAMAGHLAVRGWQVRLYNRTDANLEGARWHGGVRVKGEVEGFGPLVMVTDSIAEAVRGADVIMVVTPATAHRTLALALALWLSDGQTIVLNPGRTGGALEVRRVLDDAGCKAKIFLAEAQTFLYAARAISRHEVHILRIKDQVPLAALPAHETAQVLDTLGDAFPQFTAGSNVLATSLENIGAVFHPALTLLNAGWIEATSGRFEYYLEGITPAVAKVLEAVDAERVAVARALGVRTVTARDWLYLSYGSPGTNLRQAIRHTDAYQGIKAPPGIDHRYISEDVPMSLVPLAALGAAFGIATPAINLVVDLANLMHATDYRASGRTLKTLGLEGLSVAEIVQKAVGEPGPKE